MKQPVVYLVYHSFHPERENLYGAYASEALARLAAEGFPEPFTNWARVLKPLRKTA